MVFPLAAVLGLAGTVAGVAAQNNAAKKANAYNDPAAIRARYEAAGVNPLLGLSGGAASAVVPQIGATIANGLGNVGQLLQQDSQLQLDRDRLQVEQQALEQENRRLSQAAVKSTLSPPVGGVYDHLEPPEVVTHNSGSSDALDVQEVVYSVGGAPLAGGRSNGLGSSNSVAPDRPVDVAPYESTPMVMEVDNSVTRKIFDKPPRVFGSDGEPLGLGEGLMLAGQLGVQGFYQLGSRAGDFIERQHHDRLWRQWSRGSRGFNGAPPLPDPQYGDPLFTPLKSFNR